MKGYDLPGIHSGDDKSYLKWVKNSKTTDFPEFSLCMRCLQYHIESTLQILENSTPQVQSLSNWFNWNDIGCSHEWKRQRQQRRGFKFSVFGDIPIGVKIPVMISVPVQQCPDYPVIVFTFCCISVPVRVTGTNFNPWEGSCWTNDGQRLCYNSG